MIVPAENTTIILGRQKRFWRGGSHCSRQRDFMLGLCPILFPYLISPPHPPPQKISLIKGGANKKYIPISPKCKKIKQNKTRTKPPLNQVKIHLTSEKHFYFWNNAFHFQLSTPCKSPTKYFVARGSHIGNSSCHLIK